MSSNRSFIWEILIGLFALFVWTLGLSSFPVFADEAIYIRWAQVARNNPREYAFLPMLDGKPPLHVWSLIPVLEIIKDPVIAGRIVSLFFAFLSLFVLYRMTLLLGGSRQQARLTLLLFITLPYSFFYTRLALAESMLFFMVSLFLLGVLERFLSRSQKPQPFNLLLISIGFAASLWIKTTSMLLVLPVGALMFFLRPNKQQMIQVAIATGLGLAGFGLLIFVPLFPSLFGRSADYTFSIPELLGGEWRYVLFSSFPTALWWILVYMTPLVLISALFAGKKGLMMIVVVFSVILPLIAVGRVLNPRYFYLVLPLLLPVASIGWTRIMHRSSLLAWILIVPYVLHSWITIRTMAWEPNLSPLVRVDRVQYLEEWSSGHGIREVREEILNYLSQDQDRTLLVLTEGYFGSLPDGLQIFFDRWEQPERLEMRGVGQPINTITDEMMIEAQTREVWLVVNEHRFFETDQSKYGLIARYPRPFGAPALLLLRILE